MCVRARVCVCPFFATFLNSFGFTKEDGHCGPLLEHVPKNVGKCHLSFYLLHDAFALPTGTCLFFFFLLNCFQALFRSPIVEYSK